MSQSYLETSVLEPTGHHVRLDSARAVSLSSWLDVVTVTGDSDSLMFFRNFPFSDEGFIYLFTYS